MKKLNIIKLNTVNSTNEFAKELLKKSELPEFTCVIADKQKEGKGQHGNIWHSDKGKNLTFSLIFYPKFLNIDLQFYISKVISLGIVGFLDTIHFGFKIKWPNDIYYNNKKLGGILIENSIFKNKIKSCVAGIGLNINQYEFPEYLSDAVSLMNLSSKRYNLNVLIHDLCNEIYKNYLFLIKKEFAVIDTKYNEYLCKFNEIAEYKDVSGIFTGKIIGTEKSGKLIIENTTGAIKKYDFKEIVFL